MKWRIFGQKLSFFIGISFSQKIDIAGVKRTTVCAVKIFVQDISEILFIISHCSFAFSTEKAPHILKNKVFAKIFSHGLCSYSVLFRCSFYHFFPLGFIIGKRHNRGYDTISLPHLSFLISAQLICIRKTTAEYFLHFCFGYGFEFGKAFFFRPIRHSLLFAVDNKRFAFRQSKHSYQLFAALQNVIFHHFYHLPQV